MGYCLFSGSGGNRHGLVRALRRIEHGHGRSHAHTTSQQRARQYCVCPSHLIFGVLGRNTIPFVVTWVWADWGRLVSGHQLCIATRVRHCGLTPSCDMIFHVATGVAVGGRDMAFCVVTGKPHCGLKRCCDTILGVATQIGSLMSRPSF